MRKKHAIELTWAFHDWSQSFSSWSASTISFRNMSLWWRHRWVSRDIRLFTFGSWQSLLTHDTWAATGLSQVWLLFLLKFQVRLTTRPSRSAKPRYHCSLASLEKIPVRTLNAFWGLLLHRVDLPRRKTLKTHEICRERTTNKTVFYTKSLKSEVIISDIQWFKLSIKLPV